MLGDGLVHHSAGGGGSGGTLSDAFLAVCEVFEGALGKVATNACAAPIECSMEARISLAAADNVGGAA